jgi:dTDP-4-amino-4,6-dideoxygalactose transaminase
MVDLRAQYLHIRDQVDKNIAEVIENTAFINGPQVKAFASELGTYLNGAEVIPCANGTDALQIAMMALGLQPGDEVITASFTYVATAEAIALLHLTPILVDVDPETFALDPEQVSAAIGPRTRAVVPVHLFGQCAPMEPIQDLARQHNLYIIEDTAQAIGARYLDSKGHSHQAGTMGDIGCTSFFPSKNLGCYGDGGAMFTRNAALADRIRMVANHGQSVQYHHDEIGVNSRLDSIQAAVLRAKLPHLDRYNSSRALAAATYNRILGTSPWLSVPATAPYSTHVFHQYTLRLHPDLDRQALRDALTARKVSSMIYYPIPLHRQKAYLNPRYSEGSFPVTEDLCRRVLSLPIHSELSPEGATEIAHLVLDAIRELKG